MHGECMLAIGRVLHLVEMFLMVTISVATKWNHVLFCGPPFSNSLSWIFQCIQVTLLVNVHHYTFCHKRTVVPSVASGKSVKSRPPLICCSVAESLFFECELKYSEAVHGQFVQFSQLCIMYSMTPASTQCGLHSFWSITGLLSQSNGQQIFQISRSHHRFLGAKGTIWSKFSYWLSTNMLQYKILLPAHPCALYWCTPCSHARTHTVALVSESCSKTLCLSVCQYSKISLNQASLQ